MQLPANTKSPYAPIRYEASRPFSRELGAAFMEADKRGEAARLQFMQQSLMPKIEKAVGVGPNGPGPAQSEMVNIQIFGFYLSGGKVIYDIAKTLTQSLVHGAGAATTCGDLVFPCGSFYVHFGADAGLHDGGMAIEGAFVHHAGDRMIINLAPSGFGQQGFRTLRMGEPMIGVPVILSDKSMPVAQAVVSSIDQIMFVNRANLAKIAEMEAMLARQHGKPVSVRAGIEDLSSKETILIRAVQLLSNTLLYLAAVPQDVEVAWGRGTPVEALDALRAAVDPEARKAIADAITAAGYSKVRMVGRLSGGMR
ncbi:hypothetical protein [Hydrogenophaga sp. 2FB]|uniref:hypothetical protein n=1 Tax=Hydrogenophaga sp. 2FB TaxID=2502187 RepID=UPI0010F8178E|nr:hypothetical protein [Hydrogenophaga sp. 2FB]